MGTLCFSDGREGFILKWGGPPHGGCIDFDGGFFGKDNKMGASPNAAPTMGNPALGVGALQSLMGGGELQSIHGGSMGAFKLVAKNASKGVHLIVKLWAISLQTCKFTKNELHTSFSRILPRF